MANCSYFDDIVFQAIHNAIIATDSFTQVWIVILWNHPAYSWK